MSADVFVVMSPSLQLELGLDLAGDSCPLLSTIFILKKQHLIFAHYEITCKRTVPFQKYQVAPLANAVFSSCVIASKKQITITLKQAANAKFNN